jgi:hypothetical protein
MLKVGTLSRNLHIASSCLGIGGLGEGSFGDGLKFV